MARSTKQRRAARVRKVATAVAGALEGTRQDRADAYRFLDHMDPASLAQDFGKLLRSRRISYRWFRTITKCMGGQR